MSELRFDPVNRRWTLIAPERGSRHDTFIDSRCPERSGQKKDCPFCQDADRKSKLYEILRFPDDSDTSRWALMVTPNKYPAMRVEGQLKRSGEGLFDTVNGIGADEIIIDSPRHELNADDYTEQELFNLFSAFKLRISDLTRDIRFKYIAAFKNIGKESGQFLTHPHAQLMAMPVIPKDVEDTIDAAQKYYKEKERCLFCDIIEQERTAKTRIVFENYDFIAFCPYASAYPFEIAIYPKEHRHDFASSSEQSLKQLADIVKEMFARLSIVLEKPALTLALKAAPLKDGRLDATGQLMLLEQSYHWHVVIRPVITRPHNSAWAAGLTVNPLTPEDSAQFLKEAAII